MTLTVAELRTFVTSDLDDDALETLLDAAYEAIDQIVGVPGEITELISPGPGDLLMLARPADDVSSVIECSNTLPLTLATDDYAVRDQLLVRLRTGTNPAHRWLGRVEVTYTPISDAASRDRVAILLVKQDLNSNPALQSQRLGDFSETYAQSSYAKERAEILASLADSFVAA